jgi:hypothetical protein
VDVLLSPNEGRILRNAISDTINRLWTVPFEGNPGRLIHARRGAVSKVVVLNIVDCLRSKFVNGDLWTFTEQTRTP